MMSLATFLLLWPMFWIACLALAAWPLVHELKLTATLRRISGAALVVFACAVAYGLCDQIVFASDGEGASATDKEAATVTAPVSESSIKPASEEVQKPASEEPAKTEKVEEAKPAKVNDDQPLNTPIGESSRVIIPPGRPNWVEKPPVLEDGVQRIAVKSEPFARQSDARQALDQRLQKQTEDYVVGLLHDERARNLVQVDLKTIQDELVREENVYEEQITVSIGPMYQMHALLEFTPKFQREITQRWNALREESRLLQLALVVGSILLFIGVAFGYLRLEHATQGKQSSRLQFMAAAAILLVVGSGAALARFLIWL